MSITGCVSESEKLDLRQPWFTKTRFGFHEKKKKPLLQKLVSSSQAVC